MDELDEAYKNNGFKVPDGYFDELSYQVSSRLYPARSRWRIVIGKALSVAASIVVIISIGMMSYQSAQPEKADVSFSQLDSMDIVNYTSSVDISDEELEEIVTEEAIDAIYKAEIVSDQTSNSSIPEEEIEELEEEFNFLDI